MKTSQRAASGTITTISPCEPTLKGCTDWAIRERRSVGIPSLSRRPLTTSASAGSQRCTATSPDSEAGSGGSPGNRTIFPLGGMGSL